MCAFYANTNAPEVIRVLFRISDDRAAAFEPRDALEPGELAPLARGSGGERGPLDGALWRVGTSHVLYYDHREVRAPVKKART